jgi:hypothetical protein
MIRYNKLTAVLFFFALTLFFTGCVKKEFDKPPVGNLPVGTVYSISELRQMYADSGAIMINYDASVYAVVTMDESSGNIYKSAYIQDGADAVNLHKTSAGGLRIGDSVRVYLKNVVLSEYAGMFQLDNVNPDSNIVIMANQKYRAPEVVTIPDLLTGDYQGKLIKLNDVQFKSSDLGKFYADANGSANRTLEDCDGNSIIVRTSNYATFAEVMLPEGKGEFVAIAGDFNGTIQLYIRSLSEILLTGDRCDGGGGGGGDITPVDEVNENFDAAVDYEDIALDGWSNIKVVGERAWTGKTFNDNKYAQATGYNSGLDEMETWLITPPVINTSGDKKLYFKSAMAYWSHQDGNKPITVLASTDFDGTNFESANWVDISDKVNLPTSSSGDNNWIETSDVSLAEFTGNVTIAFKYKGSDTESTSIRIDDVKISTDGGGGGGGGDEITPVADIDESFDGAVDYEDIAFDGWTNVKIVGERAWTGKTYSGNKYAQATGYNSGLDEMETWLITPPVINTSGDLKLSFKSAMAYWSHSAGNNPLTVLASTDYNGTNFETANWTDISDMVTIPDASSEDNAWLETVDVSLAGYTGNVCIAFKYRGSDTESTSIRIDDVKIAADGGGGGGGGDALPSLNETFSDYAAYDEINKNGWVDIAVTGDRTWIAKEYSGNTYAQATGYNSELDDMETWMITPLVDNNSGDKTLTFKAEKAYWKHSDYDPMEVYVSTDFNGTNFESATWTKLSPTLPVASDDDYQWIESGDVDLSAYVGNVAIAFRYKGSNDVSTSIHVDDVVIE